MTIPTTRNSKGNRSMEVRLDRGLGGNNSFSGRAVEEVVEVGLSSRLVEAGSNFLVDLAFEGGKGVLYALNGVSSNSNGLREVGDSVCLGGSESFLHL